MDGTLTMLMRGVNAAVAYQIVSEDGKTTRTGYLTDGETVKEADLFHGTYSVTVTLPEGTLLTGVNDWPNLQKGQAQWLVNIQAMQTSRYELDLTLSGGMTGSIDDLSAPAEVTISGQRMSEQMTVSGAFALNDLYPDTYQITATLPRGLYDTEGWTLSTTDTGVTASILVEIGAGETVVLPALANHATGDASGVVLGLDGQPMSGVQVQLVNQAGEVAAEAVTDENGAWQAEFLEYGTYVVRYDAGVTLANGALVISDEPATVTAKAANPAALTIHAFRDNDNNGSRGKYEEGVSGATMSLITEVNGVEVVVASGETDKNGEVSLAVPAGTYVLRSELPAGFGHGAHGKNVSANMSIMDETTERVQNSVPLTLEAGSVTDVGVGVMTMAALQGLVWLDENDDGVYQDGEPGQAGIKIRAVGVKNGLVYETESGEDGKFYIGQMRYGTYNVEYSLPDGLVFARYSQTGGNRRSIITSEFKRSETDQVILERGDLEEVLLGVMKGSDINGICFLDENNNGVYDEGEKTLEGVKVVLYRQAIGKELLNTVSDENGRFTFANIRGSTFRVKATIPQGYVYTIAGEGEYGNMFAPGTDRREHTISDVVLENDSEMTMAIGAITYGSISGTVYLDDDFSGSRMDAEKMVNNFTVTLTDEKGNTRTAKTNRSGVYTFDDLAPGQYTVSATANRGLAFTRTGDGNILRNLSGGAGESDPVALTMGADLTGLDIGMITPGHVSGVVFADKNDNGLRDADEGGLLGAVVHLMDETGDVATRTIGADGSFLFDAVLPGTYRLRYELPGDGVFAPLADGGNTIAPDSDGTTDSFTIGVGEEVAAPLCGALALGDIEGMVFADHNGSGAQDANEAALAGVTLILTPSREDLTEQTVLTDATGAYSFTGLRPDTYTLTLRFPEGMVLSKLDGNVTLPLTHGLNEQQVNIEIGLGEEWLNQALGGVIPSKMSGQVWVDENDNGRMDAGEITPENETLTLLDETGAVFAQVQTDAEGRFAIDGIAPGVYSLAYDLKEGTQAARLGDSTFTTEGSQLVMTEIEISENNNYTAPMLGLKIDTSIGGMVWCDNAGEIAPLSGAEVILLDEKGSELQTATTGEDGIYRFDGLMPGNYRLRVTLPNGYVVVEKDDTRLKDGQNISVMTTYTAREGESDLIALRMSQHQLEQNIGAVQPGTLGDFCWLDLNGNGLQDAGELGLGDMRIELWRNDQLVAETTTDAYGYYTFENLYPGVYTLKPIYPAEVVPTRMRTDIPLIASILGENGESNPVQVTSASTTYTADLGFVLVDDDVLPANYGIGEKQDWTKK